MIWRWSHATVSLSHANTFTGQRNTATSRSLHADELSAYVHRARHSFQDESNGSRSRQAINANRTTVGLRTTDPRDAPVACQDLCQM